ncbi:MAG: hypothetical protein IPH04_20490 [Saprospirales bacterium]|nr:hypothetical protein [Saprospirales bacterium]
MKAVTRSLPEEKSEIFFEKRLHSIKKPFTFAAAFEEKQLRNGKMRECG